MEFVTLEAPFECPEDPPAELHRFLKPGQTKFRGWLKFDKLLDPSKQDGSPSDISGLEECFKYIQDNMNTLGPFDGLMGFSQGGIVFRHFYRITQLIAPEDFAIQQMPKFVIFVASPVFKNMVLNYKGNKYAHTDEPILPMPSLHINGTKDYLYEKLTAHHLFTPESKPVVIEFEDGHRFPRKLGDAEYRQMTDFLRKQYELKNGSAEGFDVTHEHYDF